MSFVIRPLSPDVFRPLFALSDAELAEQGARRVTAMTRHSAPCRVSLVDAEPGQTLILISHRHLDAPLSPYRGEGPVFVIEGASEAFPAPGSVPGMIRRRLLSCRAYDADAMMIDADVVDGAEVDARLRTWFDDPAVATVHIHTARRGCYLARAERVA